jgi:hypothetical protein
VREMTTQPWTTTARRQGNPRRAGRVPGRYQTAARLTLGCLTALSASRSRPRVTSIAVFTLPTNGTAFSTVSAAPLSHPFCRIAAPSVASAIAVPNNGIERPIRRDSRAPLQRATVRPMLMSVLGARAVPLRTIAAIWSWAPALSGKRYSVSKRFDGPHSDSGRFYSHRWRPTRRQACCWRAEKVAVPRHYTAALLVWLCIEFVDGTYAR